MQQSPAASWKLRRPVGWCWCCCPVAQVQFPTYEATGGVYINLGALLSGRPGNAICSLNGTACYRNASLFNHDCAPNVAADFPHKVFFPSPPPPLPLHTHSGVH